MSGSGINKGMDEYVDKESLTCPERRHRLLNVKGCDEHCDGTKRKEKWCHHRFRVDVENGCGRERGRMAMLAKTINNSFEQIALIPFSYFMVTVSIIDLPGKKSLAYPPFSL